MVVAATVSALAAVVIAINSFVAPVSPACQATVVLPSMRADTA